jgi:hypothetical protein
MLYNRDRHALLGFIPRKVGFLKNVGFFGVARSALEWQTHEVALKRDPPNDEPRHAIGRAEL